MHSSMRCSRVSAWRRAASLVAALVVAGPVWAQPVTQPFTFNAIPHQLPHLRHGTVEWGDFDADGDLDALISGQLVGTGPSTRLYRNDGKEPSPGAPAADSTALFTLMPVEIVGLVYSRASWHDYDNDGDLDFVVMGSETTEPPYIPDTRLYRNNDGTFGEVTDAGLVKLHSGTIAWGDYDNDGDGDLLLFGEDENRVFTTQLYRNDAGAFTAVEDVFVDLAYGDAKWGDYDADGDLDLLVAGASEDGIGARIYRNDAGGQFVDLGVDLEGVAFASVDWGDYDDDGDLDLLVAGGRVTPLIFEGVARLYRNDNSQFNTSGVIEVAGTFAGDVTWGDYDNDGDLDVLVLGAERALGGRTARVYRNDGDSFFVSSLLVGVVFGSADWGDYDGDGDLDLLASGMAPGGVYVTNLYENKRQIKPPGAPTPSVLRAVTDAGTATLSWQDPTPASWGLTYNLRVGTTPGGIDVVAPMADPLTGRRLVARPGNVQKRRAWELRGLPNGTYYWSVQSLNNAFVGSSFAAEGTFEVDGAPGEIDADPAPGLLPTEYALYANYPNPFNTSTTIRYDLPEASSVVLKVYNLLGAEVITLVEGTIEAGTHQVQWDGRSARGLPLGTGPYFYELRAGNTRYTGKMMFIR